MLHDLRYYTKFKVRLIINQIELNRSIRSYTIYPVVEGADYEVKIRAVSGVKIASPYVSPVGGVHKVVGKSARPPKALPFTFVSLPNRLRELNFLQTNWPADVRVGGGVIVKYSTDTIIGSDRNAKWDRMIPLRQTFRASPWQTADLAAGTYLIGMKLVDSTGNQSEDPNVYNYYIR